METETIGLNLFHSNLEIHLGYYSKQPQYIHEFGTRRKGGRWTSIAIGFNCWCGVKRSRKQKNTVVGGASFPNHHTVEHSLSTLATTYGCAVNQRVPTNNNKVFQIPRQNIARQPSCLSSANQSLCPFSAARVALTSSFVHRPLSIACSYQCHFCELCCGSALLLLATNIVLLHQRLSSFLLSIHKHASQKLSPSP